MIPVEPGRYLLIRHGETDWNLAGRWQGHADVPLNEAGIGQAKALAQRITGWPVKAIYSSDLLRASQTATILAQVIGVEIVHDARWRERDGGEFQGLTAAEIVSVMPDYRQEILEKGVAPPGGESNLQVAQRVVAAFDKIVSRHRHETVAVVGHGGALELLVAFVLGFPLGQRARLSLRSNAGLTVVESSEDGPRLTLLNDACHL